ncbi:MAG TPA: GNAT family N-acetyltransferase [Blastocatellia bacterium]|nr:GNAT family N-acetyltransferase [Blastocatellia bacterium]
MSNVILETGRIILREMTMDDVDDLARILSDPITMRFYPQPLDDQGVREWVARNLNRYAQDGCGLWAMVLKDNRHVVGDCGLVVQEVEGVKDLEIGYHVNRQYWGQGLATEAARACRDYGFSHFGRQKLISLIRPENIPSRRVAEKNGLRVVNETLLWKDILHYVYAIERGEVIRA